MSGLHWAKPDLISDRGAPSSLIIDSAGGLHIAGTVTRVQGDYYQNVVVYWTETSGEWTATRATDWGSHDAPALAIDVDGTGWIAFAQTYLGGPHTDCTGCVPGPLFETTNVSGEWSAPVVVGDGEFDTPSLVAHDGLAHLTYQFAGYECWPDVEAGETPAPGPDCGVQYATNAAGSWAASQVDGLTNYPEAALAVGSDGLVRIAYGRSYGHRQDIVDTNVDEIAYGMLDSTGTFDGAAILETAGLRGWGGHIELLLDANDDPYLVLTGDASESGVENWLVTRSSDGWATSSLPIDLQRVRAAVTPDGSVHTIGWQHFDRPGLWYAGESGAQFALTEEDVTGADIACDANGVLHVVYSTASGIWHTSAPTAGGTR